MKFSCARAFGESESEGTTGEVSLGERKYCLPCGTCGRGEAR